MTGYYQALDQGRLLVERGVTLNVDDVLRREIIQRLMCNGHLSMRDIERRYALDFDSYFATELIALQGLAADGLVTSDCDDIHVTERGRTVPLSRDSGIDARLTMSANVSPVYNDKVVRQFAIMTVAWGIVGMAVGVLIAAQLLWPDQSKEYAELEWPIDLLIAIVWVAYGVVFFGTIVQRKVKHIYVGNWFFAAYIITIAVLHIVNNLAIPVSPTKSYRLRWLGSSSPIHRGQRRPRRSIGCAR